MPKDRGPTVHVMSMMMMVMMSMSMSATMTTMTSTSTTGPTTVLGLCKICNAKAANDYNTYK